MAGIKQRCAECGNRAVDGPLKREYVARQPGGKKIERWVCKDTLGCRARQHAREHGLKT